VWIAQRNGRTKNGIDATDQGIIKMFWMSRPDNPAMSLAELNIIPVSISYEWEPCDSLKTKELYRTQTDGKYEKQAGEDLNSILTGILQPKGQVHIHFGNLITYSDLLPLSNLPHNKFNAQVAQMIDSQILGNYRLFANNYIACDMLSGNSSYSDYYSPEEKEKFQRYFESTIYNNSNDKIFNDIFLGIYAGPVGRGAEKNNAK